MRRSILITGSTGFTGSHLVKALVTGEGKDNVAILTRKDSDLSVLGKDLEKIKVYKTGDNFNGLYEIMQKAKPDVVVHLAGFFRAEHRKEDVDPMLKANVLFPIKLVDAMVAAGVKRLINTGTFWEHFISPLRYNPVCLYAATKRAGGDIIRYYSEADGLKSVTLEVYDTYGPKDRRKKLMHLLNDSYHHGTNIKMSPGEQYLDLLYIDDLVRAYLKAIDYVLRKKSNTPETFSIGSGKSYKLKNVVGLFENIAGRKLPVEFGLRPYRKREMMRVRADIRLAARRLGWKPEVSLQEGILRILKANDND